MTTETKPLAPKNPLSWEELKVTYIPYKLGRRADPHYKGSPAISNGSVFDGLDCRLSNQLVDQGDQIIHQDADGFVPVIGACVHMNASRFNSGYNWIRTSMIEDFYIHGDETGQLSKDKIVLANPDDGVLLDQIKEWNTGDILLITCNSMYYLKAVKRK